MIFPCEKSRQLMLASSIHSTNDEAQQLQTALDYVFMPSLFAAKPLFRLKALQLKKTKKKTLVITSDLSILDFHK